MRIKLQWETFICMGFSLKTEETQLAPYLSDHLALWKDEQGLVAVL